MEEKILITYGGLSLLFAGIMVLGLVPVGTSWSFLAMAIVGFLVAWTLPLINTVFATIMQTKVPRDKLGRVSSIDMSISSAITPIGYIISGPLSQIIGVRGLFVLSGLLGVIITLLGFIFGDLDLYRIDHKKTENVTDPSMKNLESEAVTEVGFRYEANIRGGIEPEAFTGGGSIRAVMIEKKKINESDTFD